MDIELHPLVGEIMDTKRRISAALPVQLGAA
jgi:hypothetical protein